MSPSTAQGQTNSGFPWWLMALNCSHSVTNLLKLYFHSPSQRSQMDHRTVSHTDGPVREPKRKISGLGLFTKLQEKQPGRCRRISRQQQQPWLGSCRRPGPGTPLLRSWPGECVGLLALGGPPPAVASRGCPGERERGIRMPRGWCLES